MERPHQLRGRWLRTRTDGVIVKRGTYLRSKKNRFKAGKDWALRQWDSGLECSKEEKNQQLKGSSAYALSW